MLPLMYFIILALPETICLHSKDGETSQVEMGNHPRRVQMQSLMYHNLFVWFSFPLTDFSYIFIGKSSFTGKLLLDR